MPCSYAVLLDKRLNPISLYYFWFEVHYHSTSSLYKAALRAIIPRHNHCLHGPPAVTPLVVVYQGTSCPCGVTSKPLVSHA